ncbi:MAG: hypothetical protein ACR2PG_13735 [Hyphomicrobiaceae bacterium]
MAKVNVIFHSVSGHTYRMAEELGAGVGEVETCEFNLLRIPESGGAKTDHNARAGKAARRIFARI